MPSDSTKQPLAISELPPGLTLAQLQNLMNDRIQEINLALGKVVQAPAIADVDLGTKRAINMADPTDDLDGVNLRTLKKFGGAGTTEQVQGAGGDFPTIYFAFDGLPFDGESSPFAIIMANRAGFLPVSVSLSVVGPGNDVVAANLLIAGVPMLRNDLQLDAGAQGPVFSNAFALPGSLLLGTLIQGVITQASGSSQVTIGLAIQG